MPSLSINQMRAEAEAIATGLNLTEDETNAFTHTCTSAMLTKELNAGIAELAGNLVEVARVVIKKTILFAI